MPMPPIALPPEVVDTVSAVFGARGRAWLADLPERVEALCAHWRLETVGAAFGGGTHSYAAPVRREDGSVAVLKVPIVDEENVAEAAGLFCYDGDGAVRLHDYDPGSGALLLEWARPGTPLLEQPGFPSLEGLPDHAPKVKTACALYRRLRREPGPLPSGFPAFPTVAALLTDWSDRFGSPAPELARIVPHALLDLAVGYCAELSTPQGPAVIVNRDTHLGNIVAAEREPWLLIDPKPYLGEAAFDIGFLIMIRVQRFPTAARAERMVSSTAAATAVDATRSHAWAYLRTMEEISWAVADHAADDLRLHLAVATALAAVPSVPVTSAKHSRTIRFRNAHDEHFPTEP
ncbi:aminoglycoside phosphotransferase family protein [Nocardia spumae]|uniref:aminoglycoside phosphotransferase family protein n=1 Tax=Nocardia spumae TaxID=2887190 RepID=UPI001D145987|nr:aminoglycoside phosphotransferase family protein [Nocardia spumae]